MKGVCDLCMFLVQDLVIRTYIHSYYSVAANFITLDVTHFCLLNVQSERIFATMIKIVHIFHANSEEKP